jgi:hypothetical protein
MTSRPGNWENAASVDRPGNGQVVVPIDNLFLARAFAALLKQLKPNALL